VCAAEGRVASIQCAAAPRSVRALQPVPAGANSAAARRPAHAPAIVLPSLKPTLAHSFIRRELLLAQRAASRCAAVASRTACPSRLGLRRCAACVAKACAMERERETREWVGAGLRPRRRTLTKIANGLGFKVIYRTRRSHGCAASRARALCTMQACAVLLWVSVAFCGCARARLHPLGSAKCTRPAGPQCRPRPCPPSRFSVPAISARPLVPLAWPMRPAPAARHHRPAPPRST
jgi:hypothetical protein